MLKVPFNGTEIITNSFRPKGDPRGTHLGVDYAINFRTAIIAVANGTVAKSSYTLPSGKPQKERQWVANTPSDPYKKVVFGKIINRALTTADYGNFVKIDHGSDVSTLYAHLDEVLVHDGDTVSEGQLIGYSDSTGNSTGNHLHYEIRRKDIVIDPSTFDYTFNGTSGVSSQETHPMDEIVTIVVDTLNVRHGPDRKERLSGSREVHKGDKVEVSDWVHGENIDGNDIWYKSKKGNYFWSGGTDMTGLPARKDEFMTQVEHDNKLAELEARRVSIEARRVELENAVVANNADAEQFKADWEAFAAESVTEEAVVEVPAEELKAVEVVVEPEKEEAKSLVEKLLAQAEELKAKFGL